jgi:chaperonin GroEL (HSP60 family)
MCVHLGGGAALLHLAEFVPAFIDTLQDAEEKLGAEIVRKALVCPARLIANNAGYEGDVIVESLLGTSFETGYNAVRHRPLLLFSSPPSPAGGAFSVIFSPDVRGKMTRFPS